MCTHPNLAVKIKISNEPKYRIKFLVRPDEANIAFAEKRYGKENVLNLPCGECDECKATYRYKWAKRCLYELPYHENSCFLTLTYDDVHLPSDHKLHKEDLQKFLKRLRRYTGLTGLKYLSCGEYGSNTLRPHYHLILFGYCPDDLKVLSSNGIGQKYYQSKFLDNVWKRGFVTVGEVEKDSCSYVAGYTAKKDNPVLPGFILMSKGLGNQFVYYHREDFIKNGCAVVPGLGLVTASRYEFDLLTRLGFDVSTAKKKRDDLLDEKHNTEMLLYGYEFKDQLAHHANFKVHKRKRGDV